MREMTELMVSLALTAIVVPLICERSGRDLLPPSNFGRRLAFALLNVALASTLIGVLVTPSLTTCDCSSGCRRQRDREPDVISEINLAAGGELPL